MLRNGGNYCCEVHGHICCLVQDVPGIGGIIVGVADVSPRTRSEMEDRKSPLHIYIILIQDALYKVRPGLKWWCVRTVIRPIDTAIHLVTFVGLRMRLVSDQERNRKDIYARIPESKHCKFKN